MLDPIGFLLDTGFTGDLTPHSDVTKTMRIAFQFRIPVLVLGGPRYRPKNAKYPERRHDCVSYPLTGYHFEKKLLLTINCIYLRHFAFYVAGICIFRRLVMNISSYVHVFGLCVARSQQAATLPSGWLVQIDLAFPCSSHLLVVRTVHNL